MSDLHHADHHNADLDLRNADLDLRNADVDLFTCAS